MTDALLNFKVCVMDFEGMQLTSEPQTAEKMTYALRLA